MAETPDPNATVVEPVAPAEAVEGSAAPAAAAPAASAAAVPPDQAAASAEGEAAAPVDPAASPAAAAPPVKPAAGEDWKAKKYDKVYAKLREAEAEVARLKTTPADDPAAAAARLDEAEINRRAAAQASRVEFDRKCNEVAVEARKSFPEFDAHISNLRQLVTPGDQNDIAAYSRLVEAAVETGEGGRVLFELGGNLDEAARIMALSPVRQAIEIAKLATKKGEPEPSRAPKPITPVGAGGASTIEIKPEDAARADKLSTREWIDRRQRNIDKRRAAGERIF